MAEAGRPPGLTIVTPSYEKHFVQFQRMVESLVTHCRDLDFVRLLVVVERTNAPMFSEALARLPQLASRILLTEDILPDFGVTEAPSAFLKRIGKFTFQTLKKLGALVRAKTDWSLVLDSEGLFQNPFSARTLLNDYAERKYVFYTRTEPRGALWRESTGFQVTANAAAALSMDAGERWYMEYFHWFYETDKVTDLVRNQLGPTFRAPLANPSAPSIDYFENILYYLYLQRDHGDEYAFHDFKAVLDEILPPALSARFKLDELPFSLFGNEYLLNILSPDDVPALAPLFERFRLPFVRLEPPYFSPRYLEALRRLPHFVATISSHHVIWLRKKLAVCISGEFRHVAHRTPEHHIRHLLGFLSGVDCDIYIHGWSNSSEALIIDQLKPRGHLFEERPDFSALATRIKTTEPNLKPNRDEGSLAMFHGIEQAFKLMEPYADEYDYVLRIRPDLFSDFSLKEIMVRISDKGDSLPDTIYVPKHFQSKGMNDQLALGPVAQMRIYATTFSYIQDNVERLFFNPESVLLRRLVESRTALAVVDMPYALMRNEPMRINSVHEHFHLQFGVWWSRTDELPSFTDLSAYFADKLWAMDGLMRGALPELFFVRVPAEGGGEAVIRAQMIDNDPVLHATALFGRLGFGVWSPFVVEKGMAKQTSEPAPRHLFIYRSGHGEVTVAEWRLDKRGPPGGERIIVSEAEISPRPQGLLPAEAAVLASGAELPPEVTALIALAEPEVAGRLLAGQEIAAGGCLYSRGGACRLQLQSDGNLVLSRLEQGEAAEVLWASGALGPVRRLLMQQDGNLVAYTPENAAYWASGSDGHPGSYLEVDDAGAITLTNGRDNFWRRPAADPAAEAATAEPAPVVAAGRLPPGAMLHGGEELSSPDGRHVLRFDSVAGVVVFRADGSVKPLGNVGSELAPDCMVMQEDGNLVLYAGEAPQWSTGTAGRGGAGLELSNSGDLAVTDGREVLWHVDSALPPPKVQAPAERDRTVLRGAFRRLMTAGGRG